MRTLLDKYEITNGELVVMAILAIFRTGSVYFHLSEALLPGYQSILILLVRLIIDFAIFTIILGILKFITNSCRLKESSALWGTSTSKSYILDYVILAVVWLLALIVKYPSGIAPDSWRMIMEYRNNTITDHHSVFLTLILGSFVKAGEAMGSINIAIFAFSFINYLLYVGVFGFSLNLLRKLGFSNLTVRIVTVCYLLNATILSSIGVINKDFPYSLLVFLSVCILIDIWFTKNPGKYYWRYVALGSSVLFACLIRKNGIYIYAVTAVITFFIKKIKNIKLLTYTLLISILLYIIISPTLFNMANASPACINEPFSLPFQQTARYVRDHGDEVTPEEHDAIDNILVYDTIASRYNPRISDPVKEKYTGNDNVFGPYFKTWLIQFFKHPMTYVAATWEQNYYLFAPEANITNLSVYINSYQYNEIGTYYELTMPNPFYDDSLITDSSSLARIKLWLSTTCFALNSSPITGGLSNIAMYMYALVYISVLTKKSRKMRIMLSIFWMTIVFVIIGPVIMGHTRYMYPIIYSFPVVAAFALKILSKKES